MRLVTFESEGRAGIGALGSDEDIVPFDADPGLPGSMIDFIASGAQGRARAQRLIDRGATVALTDVRLLAPVRPRNNVMCVGKNYHEHAAEFAGSGFDASQRQVVPDHPVVFTKAASSIVGPDDDVVVTADPTGTSDFEGELAVVIGPGGHQIGAAHAMDHVYGYTVVNDLTIRSLQRRHIQFFIGKSAATYCPMGPCIVTRDEIADVGQCWVRTEVNGVQRQAAPVSDLIFSIPELIASISAAVKLEPGDVIATGTPAGVGIGLDPPQFLQPGDVVKVSVDGVGSLINQAV